MPILDHFGLLAPLYDRVFSEADKDKLKRFLRLPCPGILVDVGGGTGRISQAAVGLIDHVVVVDESHGMVMQARNKGLDAVEAHAEHLPLVDGSVDRILIVDAMHHVADVPQVLSEFCRLLREPDASQGCSAGRLVIEEPDIATWQAKFVALVERLLLMRSKFYSAEELVGILSDCPVRIEVIRERGMVWVIADRMASEAENLQAS